MFRGSEKGLKEDPLFFGSPEVRSRAKKNHENEAQTCIQEKLQGLLSLQCFRDNMNTIMQPGST
jgi:hypothetical protein